MDISQKLRMQFHEFQNKLQYEPVEVKYYFKDLQYSPDNNSSVDAGKPYAFPMQTIFSDALMPDLLHAEKVSGILSQAKTLNNIVFPPESRDSIKQRVLKRILLPNGSGLDNDFDDRCRLIRTHYPDGVSMIYHYDGLGHLSLIKSTDDISIDLNYDARGRIAKIRHSKEGVFGYIWDHLNNLESVKYPDSSKALLKWDSNNRLLEMQWEGFQDINKSKTEKITFNRDKTGSLIGVRINEIFNYEFSKGNDQKIFDIHWIKDDTEKVTKVITPVGIFLLDENNWIKTKIGIDGQVTIYRYNKAGNLESIWDYGGAVLFKIYDDKFSSIVNSGGLRTLRVVDSERTIIYMIDSSGVSMESYDEYKKMVTLVNNKGIRVVYKYDKKDRLKSIEHPVNGKMQFIYKVNDILKNVTMENGAGIICDYDKVSALLLKITCIGTNVELMNLANKVMELIISPIDRSSFTSQEVN